MAKKKSENHAFQAEVSKLLDLMINSLYREKEIFLRELISNASDACDKLRYLAITEKNLLGDDTSLAVTITPNKRENLLVVADNGIGMDRDDLIDHLGTIARSGTETFVKHLSETAEKGSDQNEATGLIGQFGVGFYSAFMVAKRVEVLTRKAGDAKGWRWESDGGGSFSISEDQNIPRGTRIELHLRKDASEFLEPLRLNTVIKAYSDHVGLPIWLENEDSQKEMVNEGSALWSRPKTELKEEQYNEFYHHVSHLPGEPWHTIHMRAEGRIEYSALLYVPNTKPFDLFDPDRKHRVRLYVKRVFITDDCEGLLPSYLRFIRGVIDSSDLTLNISRETLQHNPILAKIRTGVTKRIFSDIGKRAKKSPDEYAVFWENFGAVLKEGLYEDPEQKEQLLKLARFRSTESAGEWHSLDDYVGAMIENQDSIYYISGEDKEVLRDSPQIEGFRARGLDVLLMSDPVDQFWLPTVGTYKDKHFKSVTQGAADLERFSIKDENKKTSDADQPPLGQMDKLIALVKLTLGDMVKDVRASDRLTDSPVCLVADEGDLDIHLEHLLRQQKQDVPTQKRVLELNPSHSMTRALAMMVGKKGASDTLENAAHLLLDQARILEGEPLPDPPTFSKRLSKLVSQSLEL